MKEIGGYLQLDTYNLPMIHENAIALNCGRNALAYILEAKKIKKIWLPIFLCDSVSHVCKKYQTGVKCYHINKSFEPVDVQPQESDWIYIVNYYGQLTEERITILSQKYKNIIVDNAHNYYAKPIKNIDTLYTCRKFWGVSDGAFLYTDTILEREIPQDISFERMHFVLGRYEKSASDFYIEASQNNDFFGNEPIKKMSKLTWNLLHAIDYEKARMRRTQNFKYLFDFFGNVNALKLRIPDGAFMYPLMIPNAYILRRKLIEKCIYIPVLWPEILQKCPKELLEYKFASDILPIPCDQRYSLCDMKYLSHIIKSILFEGD